MTEKQIENLILQWLNSQPGTFAFKVQTTGIYDTKKKVFRTASKHVFKGTSDILGIKGGIFFAIEVKTPKSLKTALSKPKPSDIRQMEFLEIVKRHEGFGVRVCSLDQVIEFMKIVK